MTYRIRNLVIAIGLALTAMMLTFFYVTNYKRSVKHEGTSVPVYVAARDIPAGVNGADLVREHALRVTDVRRSDVVPGAISQPDQIQGLFLSAPLFAGEQVTLRRFSDVAAQGIRAQLKGTMRAIQVPGDANQLLAGTLTAGDHVDLVANLRSDPEKDLHETRIVLRDIPVLDVGGGSATARVAPGGSGSVILAVTDTQVQRVFFVLKNADWSLELRPVVNPADSRERVETITSVLNGGLR